MSSTNYLSRIKPVQPPASGGAVGGSIALNIIFIIVLLILIIWVYPTVFERNKNAHYIDENGDPCPPPPLQWFDYYMIAIFVLAVVAIVCCLWTVISNAYFRKVSASIGLWIGGLAIFMLIGMWLLVLGVMMVEG